MADPEYFTTNEFRELRDMGDSARFPEADVLREAARATADVEREVGTSFIYRAHEEALDGDSGEYLVLERPFAQAITACTVGGTSVLSELLTPRGGVVRFQSEGRTWTRGRGNIEIEYTAGYSAAPPADVKGAVMDLTRYRLLSNEADSADDPRVTSRTTDLGGTITYAVAGTDHPTGYPDVDTVIVAWRDRLDLFGFA